MQILCAGGMCHVLFFFFNDTATTEIYTLSLHDALPIFVTATSGIERKDSAVMGLLLLDIGNKYYMKLINPP